MAKAIAITFKEIKTRYNTEDACQSELFHLRFPEGFTCSVRGCQEYYTIRGRNTFRCHSCWH